jgi:hypothetical protein
MLISKRLRSKARAGIDLARQLPFRESDRKLSSFGKAFRVQKIGWIVAILCAVSWLASEINLPGEVQTAPAREETGWRRTAEGWENVNDWTFAIEKSTPALHPCVMGLLMVALSLAVGIAKKEPALGRE